MKPPLRLKLLVTQWVHIVPGNELATGCARWKSGWKGEAHSQALQLSEKLGASGVQQRHESTMALSEDLLHLRDWPVAETIHRKFIQECGLGEDDPRLPDHWAFLDFAEFAQGKGEESKLIRDRPVSTSSGTRMAYAWVNLAAALSTAGKYDKAARRLTARPWSSGPDRTSTTRATPGIGMNSRSSAFRWRSLGEEWSQ